eukprot:2309554-Prymnesium_polylepis.1
MPVSCTLAGWLARALVGALNAKVRCLLRAGVLVPAAVVTRGAANWETRLTVFSVTREFQDRAVAPTDKEESAIDLSPRAAPD